MTIAEPSNTVVVSPTPNTRIRDYQVETATNMYAKRLVKWGTGTNDISVCGADEMPIGVLGWEDCNDAYRPSTITTIYVAGNRAPVISGQGTIVQLRLADNQVIVRGDQLIPAANGEVVKASALTTDSGSTAVTAPSSSGAIISGDVGDAPVVAIAEEDVTTDGAAADIMARLER